MTDTFFPEEQEGIIKEFLDESEVHIETLNKDLLIAEENVQNNKNVPDEIINEMFRAVHTIKGAASFLGFSKVHTLAHNMETLMDKVRKKEMVLTNVEIDVLFKGFDGLEKLLSSLADSGGEKLDIEDYLEVLESVTSGKAKKAKPKEEESKKEAETKQDDETKKEEPKKPKPKKIKAEKKEEEPQAKPRVIKIDKSKYIAEFIDDTNLNVDKANNILLELEKNNEDEELLRELFRIAHTIKGAAGTMGIVPIEETVHKMESIMHKVTNKELKMTDEMLSCMFSTVDSVSEMVKKISKDPDSINDVNTEDLKKKLEDLLEGKAPAKKEEKQTASSETESTYHLLDLKEEKEIVLTAIQENNDIFYIHFTIRNDIPIKDIKLLLVKERLAQIGIILKVIPDPEGKEVIEEECASPHIFCGAKVKAEEIENIIGFDGMENILVQRISPEEVEEYKKEFMKEEEATKTEEEEQKVEQKKQKVSDTSRKLGLGGATIRIDIGKLDNLMNLAGELVIIKAQLNQLVNNLGNNFSRQRGMDSKLEGFRKNIDEIKNELTSYTTNLELKNNDTQIEFSNIFSQIDRILNEEKVSSEGFQTEKIATVFSDLNEATSKLGKISSDIQNGIMETRMIPIEGLFSRFRRVVRDMAKELNKDISLIIIGEETELDKKIIDDLGDPLTHMIRNAIDHGIESKEDRRKKGKPEKGTIILKAFHEGNRICIEISDNGKGINKEAVVKKAINKGLVDKEHVEDLSDREKLDFIFMPGFSTAKEVTELSGRGVGMDVVRKMIENVNGSVDISSELSQGTTFILKIPLTLAIIPALLVIVGDIPYAFPLESVLEIIKVKKDEIYSIDGNETVKLRDHALSIINLEKVIGIRSNNNKNGQSQKVVVISDGNEQVGVSVDDLIGEEEIVIKSLSEHFVEVIGIAGASVLGDGRISLILDPLSVIKEAKSNL